MRDPLTKRGTSEWLCNTLLVSCSIKEVCLLIWHTSASSSVAFKPPNALWHPNTPTLQRRRILVVKSRLVISAFYPPFFTLFSSVAAVSNLVTRHLIFLITSSVHYGVPERAQGILRHFMSLSLIKNHLLTRQNV